MDESGLPVQPAVPTEPAPSPAAPPALRPSRRLGRRRVLVACSDPTLCVVLEEMLRRHADDLAPDGVEVRRVLDGVACLQALELSPPDLLVVQARLDRMDGTEVIEAWRQSHPGQGLPVILLSAAPNATIPADLGAATLPVPFEGQEFLAEVARILVRA